MATEVSSCHFDNKIKNVDFVHCLLTTSCKSGFSLPTKDAQPSTETPPTCLLPLIVFEGLAGVGRGEFVIHTTIKQ